MATKKSSLRLDSVPVYVELKRYGMAFEPAGGVEVKVCCPFHGDESPSCHVNLEKRVFHCKTANCEQHGDLIDLLAKFKQTTRPVIIADLATRYDIEDEKTIDPTAIERWHEDIWNHDYLRNELCKRGLNDAMIRRHRLGVQVGKTDVRITIPIRNTTGSFVNVRKYLPGAPGPEKMKNTAGFGKKPRWFPVDQLQYDTILITGGECKAIVALEELNAYSIGAVAGAWGESNLVKSELTRELKGKRIYICLDVDSAGQGAATKLAYALRMICPFVAIIILPLDTDKYPKGDINDYVASEGGKLKPLIDAAIEFNADVPDKLSIDVTEPVDMHLSAAVDAEHSGKRINVKCVVSAMDTTPFFIPKDILIQCPKDQSFCGSCPVSVKGRNTYTIPEESIAILEFIHAPSTHHLEIVKSAIGIPQPCRVCEFEKLSEYNIQDTRVSPQLETSNRYSDRQPIPAVCIGTGLQPNEAFEFTGKFVAHPKTQQAVMLVSKHTPSQDALATFQFDDESAAECQSFWPVEHTVEAIGSKLDGIYNDLSTNITKIRGRHDLHFAVDLLYHSPLLINIDGQQEKGWIELLVVGDSRTGKSKVAKRLIEHYQLGFITEASNCTAAGIIGGMEKMNERWFVSWGLLVRHDQRLVIIDEFSTGPEDVLARIRDARYSGQAKITKIGLNWAANSRVRLGVFSNCPNELKVDAYPYGIAAVKDLINSPPDISRFDLALITTTSDVDKSLINMKPEDETIIEHTHTTEKCRKLVLWAWSRTCKQIQFTPEAISHLYDASKGLEQAFDDAIPLVDRGSMRYKLARMAASLAARLFSCSDDYQSVIVHWTHVEYISQFLHRIYSSPTFGYDAFSKAQKITRSLLDPELVKKCILGMDHPRDFVRSILAQDYIDKQDIADWADVAEPQPVISLLMRKHAIMHRGRYYRKTAPFICFLKELENDPDLLDGTDRKKVEF